MTIELTIDQSRQWLQIQGVALSLQTLRYHCQAGRLAARKVGQQYRITPGALERFMTGRRGK